MDDDFRKAALAYHRLPRPGKLSVEATKRMANQRDLALAYSPGVAAACEAIVDDPAQSDDPNLHESSSMARGKRGYGKGKNRPNQWPPN